jgi:hypothetical protein
MMMRIDRGSLIRAEIAGFAGNRRRPNSRKFRWGMSIGQSRRPAAGMTMLSANGQAFKFRADTA